MTRIPLISDRIVIPTGDRSNIPSLVGWDTVEIGFIENCPRTLPAIPASFRRRINSIILRMYGGYNGKEINRTTSLVHFYPSVIHRDLLNEPDPDSIHFYSRVDRVDPPIPLDLSFPEIIYFIGRSKWPKAASWNGD